MSQALEEKTASVSADQVADGETTRLRVAHVVLSLDVGGLERNVINQVREGQALGQSVSVICLEAPGMLAEKVEALGGPAIQPEETTRDSPVPVPAASEDPARPLSGHRSYAPDRHALLCGSGGRQPGEGANACGPH